MFACKLWIFLSAILISFSSLMDLPPASRFIICRHRAFSEPLRATILLSGHVLGCPSRWHLKILSSIPQVRIRFDWTWSMMIKWGQKLIKCVTGHGGACNIVADPCYCCVFKIVGTAAIPLLFWAVVAAKLQTIVSHLFLHRFLRFFK
jgi:hypothetical protein